MTWDDDVKRNTKNKSYKMKFLMAHYLVRTDPDPDHTDQLAAYSPHGASTPQKYPYYSILE